MQTSFVAPDIECDGCANSIRKALAGTAGVRAVDVDLPSKTVTVDFDPAALDVSAIAAQLGDIGFPTRQD